MSVGPSETGANGGRDARGRFTAGNRAARGNPYARRAQRFRAELFRRVRVEDVGEVIDALLMKARGPKGSPEMAELAAIRELLDRLIGKADIGPDVLARLDALEAAEAARADADAEGFTR